MFHGIENASKIASAHANHGLRKGGIIDIASATGRQVCEL
jgi:Leu/Phe-tRNA-protein transferase